MPPAKKARTCPCGSGRPAADCCEGRTRRRIRDGVIAVLLIVVGTATAMLVTSAPEPAIPAPEASTAVTPAPYQYDPATDKHWDPDHGHWHPGPPPANPLGGDGVAAPPNIPNPEPWQYDAASNRHYDPGHGHWHNGPPPAGADGNTLSSPVGTDRVAAPPGIVNPQPWQYDAASDKHYHPGHRHWHAGPPPDPAQR